MSSIRDISTEMETLLPIMKSLHDSYKGWQKEFIDNQDQYAVDEVLAMREQLCQMYVATYEVWQDINGVNLSMALAVDRKVRNQRYDEIRRFRGEKPEIPNTSVQTVNRRAVRVKSNPLAALRQIIAGMSPEQKAAIADNLQKRIDDKEPK